MFFIWLTGSLYLYVLMLEHRYLQGYIHCSLTIRGVLFCVSSRMSDDMGIPPFCDVRVDAHYTKYLIQCGPRYSSSTDPH